MQSLSPPYKRIKHLRSSGKCAAAISMLRSNRPVSDLDAFEAVVCLFVCGDMESAVHVCRTHPWKQAWALQISGALTEGVVGGNASTALTLARKAVSNPNAPPDASAIYLLLLQENRLIEEADAYIKRCFESLPFGETFLLTIIGEHALRTRRWRDAYRAASAVLAADPDDYRALLLLGMANYEIGNVHEALGNATRASFINKGAAPAILQIMRCQNKLGDYYAALAAFDGLADKSTITPDMRLELGTAYLGLEDRARAAAEYRTALESGSRAPGALRALVGIYTSANASAELGALVEAHSAAIGSDIECLYWLGLQALNERNLDEAARLFGKTRTLAEASSEAMDDLPWPIPEPRIRHDCEQLELLQRRGRLPGPGHDALQVLKKYCGESGDANAAFAPEGAEADALKSVLCTTYAVPEVPFAGNALGENDYGAIEDAYLKGEIVVIDDFLSAEALAALRRFCEEATIWKINNARGYVGAILSQGFSPRVLLSTADALRRAMPRVLKDQPLLQAWAFKYDQRMQGINMHADFAKVNVNFWITPDEACADPSTGGMVVYDVPVPKSWTFAEYSTQSDKLAAYLRVHSANARRVPYRSNRCVLFDSSLIHITDEMHFRPGYENRRVNVTLLYGRARTVD